MLLQFLEKAARQKQEHAAVPQVAVRYVLLSSGGVRLLGEAGNPPAAVREVIAGLDVAIAGFCGARRDPERDQISLAGEFRGRCDGLTQRGFVSDDMVGGENQQARVVDFGGEGECRGGHCGCGIASDRLEDDQGVVAFAELMPYGGSLLGIGHDHWRSGSGQRCGPFQRGPEHRAIVDQRQQLLGLPSARSRPQPGP